MENGSAYDKYGDYFQRVICEGAGGLDRELESMDARERFELRDVPNLPEHAVRYQELKAELSNLKEHVQENHQKIEEKEAQLLAVQHIPVVFDTPDFALIENHLAELSEAGIASVKVGDRVYTLQQLTGLLKVVDEYSVAVHTDQHGAPAKQVNLEHLDALFAEHGITRQKISPHSGFGFRECMQACVERDRRFQEENEEK